MPPSCVSYISEAAVQQWPVGLDQLKNWKLSSLELVNFRGSTVGPPGSSNCAKSVKNLSYPGEVIWQLDVFLVRSKHFTTHTKSLIISLRLKKVASFSQAKHLLTAAKYKQ